MPTLKLTLNIGTIDARRLGLDKTQAGEEVGVDDKVAAILLKNGWAVEPGKDGPGPGVEPIGSVDLPAARGGGRTHLAIAPEDPGATPEPAATSTATPPDATPDLDGMTKDELKSYADENQVDGVTMAMSKDDMIRAIKRAARRR